MLENHAYLQILEVVYKQLEKLLMINDVKKIENLYQWFIRTIQFVVFGDPPQSILWWISQISSWVSFAINISQTFIKKVR